MTFLSGPPDLLRGAVRRPKWPKAPSPSPPLPPPFDPSFTDTNPYSYLQVAQASGSAAELAKYRASQNLPMRLPDGPFEVSAACLLVAKQELMPVHAFCKHAALSHFD